MNFESINFVFDQGDELRFDSKLLGVGGGGKKIGEIFFPLSFSIRKKIKV